MSTEVKRFSFQMFAVFRLSGKSGLDTTLYILRGVAIGNTILTYTAHPANKPQITSEPKHVQVLNN